MERALPESKKESLLHRVFFFISSCMTPLIPSLLGCGMVRVLITLLSVANLIDKHSDACLLLSMIGNCFFIFLPIILSASVAKQVEIDPILGMLIGGITLQLLFVGYGEEGTVGFSSTLVGQNGYAACILPIFLTVPLMRFIDRVAEKLSPSLIKVFFKPFLTLLAASFWLIALAWPIGNAAGALLTRGVLMLEENAHALAVALLAAAMPFIMLTGLHYSLFPLAALSFSSLGYDPLVSPAMLTAAFSLAGASLAAATCSRTKKERQISFGATLSAVLAGVTEPALFGVTLRYRHSLISVSLASGVAGLLAGARGSVVYRSGTAPSLFTLLQMLDQNDPDNLFSGLLVLTASFALSFLASLLIYRKSNLLPDQKGLLMNDNSQASEMFASKAAANTAVKTLILTSPLSGKRIPLEKVRDETFAEGYLGRGCAVIPTDGHVYAPANGKIISLFETRHAVTILSDDGTEILIHVGRDTVTLGGRYFKAYRQNGDEVKTGDLILSFDLDALEKEGFDLTTPIVVTNDALYKEIETFDNESVTAGDPLLRLTDDGRKA